MNERTIERMNGQSIEQIYRTYNIQKTIDRTDEQSNEWVVERRNTYIYGQTDRYRYM
jgi:hypothetical protein